MSLFKRRTDRKLPATVQMQETDERHFLSQQVFFRRENRGWSQVKLADEAGMTQAQIATIEAGQANPTLRTLVKVAHALGCSVKNLMSPDDEQLSLEPAMFEFSPVIGAVSRAGSLISFGAQEPWVVFGYTHPVHATSRTFEVLPRDPAEPDELLPAARHLVTRQVSGD